MFQTRPNLEELLLRRLNLTNLPLQLLQSLVDILDFGHETKLGFIPTKFNIRAMRATFQPGLSDLQRRRLVLNPFPHDIQMFLHVVQLFLDLESVGTLENDLQTLIFSLTAER